MSHYFWMKSFKTPEDMKSPTPSVIPRNMRALTWGNILLQLLFPLSLSFNSVIAAPQPPPTSVINISTEPYVLGVGENVNSVAKKYNLSVSELKRINIYRTFYKSFAELTTGDEIDIPRKQSPFSADNEKNKNSDIVQENKFSDHVQAGALVFANGNVAKSSEQLLRATASNEFNSSAQQWLSQFGTAQVQMNVNDDFKLDGSAIDVLVPLYDNQKSILFTQLGARNKDSRNTLNIGAGVRTFQNDWMYGVNTFFDNDITGNNRRVGVGAEVWADYLKLSANSYFGTTDWHQSRDFADYNERPANGYDVRAEAYLPAHPQLGGKLMYEKYRGEEVALFGKDNRQKNPYAVTAGVNYTPIPLLTVGAEHRAGKGSKNDSSLNVLLNYRLGESWQSHINPSAVATTRTLAGSRYDLVERNNNIVLDYQKQQLMRLTLPEQITGEEGLTATVNAQVVSKYALERIEWDSTALIAAGGTIVPISPQAVAITLPAYQVASSSNVYTLGAVAYDQQGNTSQRATMQVTVIQSTVTTPLVALTVTTDGAVANGIANNAVQVRITGSNNAPISGRTVTFTADNSASITTVIGTTGTDGIATATLTNTLVGASNVTAQVDGNSYNVATTFVVIPLFTGITTNGFDFTMNSGFPSTGFSQGVFTINVSGTATDYSWSSNQPSAVSVDSSGKVTLIQAPSGTVTITAIPSSGGSSTPLTYTFTVGTWFENDGANQLNWANANALCLSRSQALPTKEQLTRISGSTGIRMVGNLFGEWGNLSTYVGSDFKASGYYWTSTVHNTGTGEHNYVSLNNGGVYSLGAGDAGLRYTLCQRAL